MENNKETAFRQGTLDLQLQHLLTVLNIFEHFQTIYQLKLKYYSTQ